MVVAGDDDAAGTVVHELAHKFGIGDTYNDARDSSLRCSVNPAPRTPAILDGVYAITWTGSDPDNDDVTYTVSYNPDVTDPDSPWIILIDDLDVLTWQEDFSLLPGGAHAVIRVTAGDGVLCTDAESVQFAVPFKAPEVFIDELPWGNSYKPGSDILLVVDVFDLQNETIPGDNIVWTSSITGELGNGAERLVKNLPKGVQATEFFGKGIECNLFSLNLFCRCGFIRRTWV